MSDLAAKMSRQNKRPATQAAPVAAVATKENDGETTATSATRSIFQSLSWTTWKNSPNTGADPSRPWSEKRSSC